jgi:hypothetical protein
MSRKKNILIEAILLFIALLIFSYPINAQPPSEPRSEPISEPSAKAEMSVHKAKVIEHWTPERLKAAKPRDLFLDAQGKAYMGDKKSGFSPYGQSPNNETGAGPDISNMSPADGATLGASSTFSAEVIDDSTGDSSGVRSVSIVIQYPNGNSEAFRARNSSGNTWSVNLSGFSDSPNWAWWVEAKDKAKQGGNRSTSAVFNFSVSTGSEPPVDPPEEPPADGVIENAQWPGSSNNGGVVQSAAGRIYFEMPNNSKRKGPWSGYVCSGTVIFDGDNGIDEILDGNNINNQRGIIITAAHCAYDDVNKAFARNVLFIPNQGATTGSGTDSNCSNDPMGCWAPHFAVVDDDWSSRTFPNNIPWDYAYYVVADSGAHSGTGVESGLQAAAGNMHVSFATPYSYDGNPGASSIDYTHALGYSYSEDPNFMYCAQDMTTEDYKVGQTENWWLANCGLSGGSSGGPWVQPMASGDGPIISVNSWGYTTTPGMAGPFLHTSSAECLYIIAESTDFSSINTTDGEAGLEVGCQ